jgi:hypothetical protein
MIDTTLHASKVFTTWIIVFVDTLVAEKLKPKLGPLIEFIVELGVRLVDELITRV